ncbi:hypothetical protein BD410DRAFT_763455 [Rickenella mellea]|uniref:Rap-GAP domain-containing protein n=1 Tax=Rickenella mellea TaxID=50990 RepID=A0A4Y7QIP9_9AGAM|nr:hypothetical protein BD410DRAFT_763455 [Rickenella mellea]
MSPQQQDAHGTTRPRARTTTATTSFGAFAWRRNKPDSSSMPATPAAPIQTQPIETIIQALMPPAVPSLTHARSLVVALSTQTSVPSAATLTPILASLCSERSPPALQAAGFDILAAYCLCGSGTFTTSDCLGFFEQFRPTSRIFIPEVWEPRFKALQALLSTSEEFLGTEKVFQDLTGYINSAFDGLLTNIIVPIPERTERERAVDALSDHLSAWISKPDISGRLSDEDITTLFDFYAGLFDRGIRIPSDSPQYNSVPPTPVRETNPSGMNSPMRHRRHPSSTSVITSPIITTPPRHILRHPAQIAASIYLRLLESQIERLPSSYLSTLLPLLFRILSQFMSPLPIISLPLAHRSPTTEAPAPLVEKTVTEAITSLLQGPYSTTCLILLKKSLLPFPDSSQSAETQVRIAVGAHRTLRHHIRGSLEDRLAMLFISRDAARSANHAGAPGSMALGEYVLERAQRAWKKDGNAPWDARKIGYLLSRAVKAWISWTPSEDAKGKDKEESAIVGKEKVLEEVAGLLKDVLQEMDDRAEDDYDDSYDENASAVGEILFELANYVRPLKNEDGSPLVIPLTRPRDAPSPILRILSTLLARDHHNAESTPATPSGRLAPPAPNYVALSPPLPIILLSIAEHLQDADTSKIPTMLAEQHHLAPTSPDWLDNWRTLFANSALFAPDRPQTRTAILSALQSVHAAIKDMPAYRRPLAELIFDFWVRIVQEENEGADGGVMWRVLGDEVVLRAFEGDDWEDGVPDLIHEQQKDVESVPKPGPLTIIRILDAMTGVASIVTCAPEEELRSAATIQMQSPDTVPPSPLVLGSSSFSSLPSSTTSPTLSRTQTDTSTYSSPVKDKEPSTTQMPIMSFFSSLASGSSRAQNNIAATVTTEEPQSATATTTPITTAAAERPAPPCASVSAVIALIDVFTQLAFSDRVVADNHASLALHVVDRLITLLRAVQTTKVRLAILQFLLRLRADRDHRLYFKADPAAHDQHVVTLAWQIERTREPSSMHAGGRSGDEQVRADDASFDEARRARPRHVFVDRDRDGGRRASRGRGSGSQPTPSRSRSRAPARVRGAPPAKPVTPPKPREPLWAVPDVVLFSTENADKVGQALLSYDPVGPDHKLVLSISSYLQAIIDILRAEKDWEILSYVLVHLPVQLANKHFWCGPKGREVMTELLAEVISGVLEGNIGRSIPQETWPGALKARDAQCLAYHTLTVLISYSTVFDMKWRHAIVEAFQAGLSEMPLTVKCCLHALSLCAFEMQQSMVKALPRILEKLSQIMSNPAMAAHILDFLCIVGSQRTLFANFTENDFKRVFGVALQYLQHHNRPETMADISFALSQHVRIVCYYLLYTWFLAVRLPDRPLHVSYIGRQLLLANEGRDEVDEPTEVCFDWLARYTYASADPRPADSLLTEIISLPPKKRLSSPEPAIHEKSWVVGFSIVTIRTLARAGWLEVVSRRASGTTKFLCKVENVPMVGLGEVDADLSSIPASLMMDRRLNMRSVSTPSSLMPPPDIPLGDGCDGVLLETCTPVDSEENPPPRPDPITGYVWSDSAPSQRRKHVDLDPSYFPLQLSAYPDILRNSPRGEPIRDVQALARQLRNLDRMPVIDTHKVGILYAAPGQSDEIEILRNTHGSPAYTRFLEGIGRLLKLRGQRDVYAGGLEPDVDGEYAYAWWDDIGQILYHTATLMPTQAHDERCNNKKSHIGNDYVRIVWNDSGLPYKFDTLTTEFQFVNIVIEPHSYGTIAAYSNNVHENEYFKVTVQRAEGMAEFTPIGDFKIVSAASLPLLVRQLSLLADWYASVFQHTVRDTEKTEFITNWRARFQAIKRFAATIPHVEHPVTPDAGIMAQEALRDFTAVY